MSTRRGARTARAVRSPRSGRSIVGGLIVVGFVTVAVVVGAAVVGAVVPWLSVPGGFDSTSFAASTAVSQDDSGAELLARAREAATAYDFTGEVVVEWRADGTVHRERVPVRETDGVLRLGEQRKIIGAGDDRLMARDGAWKRLWSGSPGSTANELAAVDPERKYRLVVSDGPRTAGRPTTAIEVRRLERGGLEKGGAGTGRTPGVAQRFAVDDATGLLLRREQLDHRGRITRGVRFVELREPTPTAEDAGSRRTDPPAAAPRGEGSTPEPISKATPESAAPRRLGDGFLRTGRYRAPDGSRHFFYSDGIYAASVFEQEGELDGQELPDDATSTRLGGHTLTSYATAGGTVVVWSDDDHVYTLVSDAPARDLDAIVDDLPGPMDPDTATEVARFVLAPFRW